MSRYKENISALRYGNLNLFCNFSPLVVFVDTESSLSSQGIHDKFFRKTFGEVRVTRDFLQNYLPRDVVSAIALDTLKAENGSFVEETLKDAYSDLLFSAEIGGHPGYLYFLFEHKSYGDKFAVLQLLKYMVSIWDRVRNTGGDLPLILPVLIYHGEKRWSHAKLFPELFAGMPANLLEYVPNFRLLFYDFTNFSDAELKGEVLNRVTLLTMKHIFSPDLQERLPEIFSLLSRLAEDQTGLDYLKTFLYYLTGGADRITKAEFYAGLERQLTAGENVMPTIAQEWIEQGIQQGMQQGKIEVAKKLLDSGESLAKVLSLTGLTEMDLRNANILSGGTDHGTTR